MFGDVVMEIAKTKFDAIFDAKKEEHGYEFDVDLTTEDLEGNHRRIQGSRKRRNGKRLPSGTEGSADGSNHGCIPLLEQ